MQIYFFLTSTVLQMLRTINFNSPLRIKHVILIQLMWIQKEQNTLMFGLSFIFVFPILPLLLSWSLFLCPLLSLAPHPCILGKWPLGNTPALYGKAGIVYAAAGTGSHHPPVSPAKMLWLSSWCPCLLSPASTSPFFKWTWSAGSCLPRLCYCELCQQGRPNTLSNALADFKDLKKNPSTFTYHPQRERAVQAQLKRDSKMCAFLQTALPFYHINSLKAHFF
jgi:hypothetical protein